MTETLRVQEKKEWQPTGERILITGFSGLVGDGIVRAALGRDKMIGVSRGVTASELAGNDFSSVKVDLFDKDGLLEIIQENRPSILIHLAAATNVDKCQENSDWAQSLNVEATGNVVEVCRVFEIPLIYFSTDYVFPRVGGPFSETDVPAPLNIYGQTKREGEFVVEGLPENQRLVVRIASPYNHRYLAKQGTPPVLFNLLKEGKKIKAVTDAQTTYTYVPDIADVINRLISEKIWEKRNVVHIAGPDQLSALDIMRIARKYISSSSEVEEMSQDQYFSGKAPRPLKGGLITETLDELGIRLRSWEEVLREEILG